VSKSILLGVVCNLYLDALATICLIIFGMIPKTHVLESGDEELCIVYLLWLGLIPKFIQAIILQEGGSPQRG